MFSILRPISLVFSSKMQFSPESTNFSAVNCLSLDHVSRRRGLLETGELVWRIAKGCEVIQAGIQIRLFVNHMAVPNSWLSGKLPPKPTFER